MRPKARASQAGEESNPRIGAEEAIASHHLAVSRRPWCIVDQALEYR